jgi:hypothetical protein
MKNYVFDGHDEFSFSLTALYGAIPYLSLYYSIKLKDDMRVYLLLLGLSILTVFACSDDQEVSGVDVLNYDGENSASPNLPPGEFGFAARFPSLITRNAEGRTIKSISFYLYERPESLVLRMANDETSRLPGTPFYSQDLSGGLAEFGWNTIDLDQAVTIDGQSLWVILEFTISGGPSQVIGCDQGPANANGDWLYDEADGNWERFEVRLGESVNWNIRVLLDD